MTVRQLSEANFEETIKQEGVVLIDFWASWCGPCRAFGPIYEKVAGEYPDVTFTKLNTEENRELSTALGIRSIPTLMAFRDGVLVFNQAGMVPARALRQLVDQVNALDMAQVRAEMEKARAAG